MEEKFSNWLLDIAKYVVTAIILSNALRDAMHGWQFYAVSFGLVLCIVGVGVYLHFLAERKKKRKEKKEKESKVQQSNN